MCALRDFDDIINKPIKQTIPPSPSIKEVFFQHGKGADETVVALCEIATHPLCVIKRTVVISEGGHAEDNFIRWAKQELKAVNPLTTVTIVMMITKSPCKNCQINLKEFLKNLARGKFEDDESDKEVEITINFTLRVANAYRGPEMRPVPTVMRELSQWAKPLNITIEPIAVVDELDAPQDWKTTRKVKDKKISYFIEMRDRKAFEHAIKISSNDKTTFYKSHSEQCRREAQVALVETASVEIILCKKDKKTCYISSLNQAEFIGSQTKTLIISTTHVPCVKCLQLIKTITRKAQVQTLTLRVANIRNDDKDLLVMWIMYMRCEIPTLELEAVMVVWEMTKNKPRDTDEKDWNDVVMERIKSDNEVDEKVKSINEKLRATNKIPQHINKVLEMLLDIYTILQDINKKLQDINKKLQDINKKLQDINNDILTRALAQLHLTD